MELGKRNRQQRICIALMIAMFAVSLLGLQVTSCIADDFSVDAVVARMAPYDGESVAGVDVSTMTGKVMCGYQGWYTAPGDGSHYDWLHYRWQGEFRPGRCSIDLWPDVSELDEDERYPTEFRHADGRVAEVFSSMNGKTVDRHFHWMEQHGIDGAFVQRFVPKPGNGHILNQRNTVLSNCRAAANHTGRCYALMYDMHFDADRIDIMRNDWKRLVDRMKITDDKAYLHHAGRPIIALWGVGFADRGWDAKAASELIDYLKNDPKYGGMTVMLGVPAYWRTLGHDCIDDASLHDVIAKADIICPWSVGRFRRIDDIAHHTKIRTVPDMEWCKERDIEYMPVVFPGFSWYNMKPEFPLGYAPRLKGQFLWRQYLEARSVGATMVYQAMFDEMDEGTSIFKCTNDPPVGESKFLDNEGLPTDHYLWLTGMGARLIRGEIEPDEILPPRDGQVIIPPIRIGYRKNLDETRPAAEKLRDHLHRMFVGKIELIDLCPDETVETEEENGESEDNDCDSMQAVEDVDFLLGLPGENPQIIEAVEADRIKVPDSDEKLDVCLVKTIGSSTVIVAQNGRALLLGIKGLIEHYGAKEGEEKIHYPEKKIFGLHTIDETFSAEVVEIDTVAEEDSSEKECDKEQSETDSAP